MNKQMERKIGQDRIVENVIYKRELNHSYMVLPCQDKDMAERYDYRIMQHNRIGGLLPCSLRYLDGEELLYYDITSRQPLARLYESRRMKAADLERIIRDTAAVQAQLGEYMLDESGVLLEEEVIFADVETGELYFAFYPGGLLCAVLFSAVSGERDGGFEADRAGKGARLVRVRGVHGKRWTKRRRGRFGRLELQEYRWGAHNAAGWRMACRAAKK